MVALAVVLAQAAAAPRPPEARGQLVLDAAAEGELAPIPLEAGGEACGAVFDAFRLSVRLARASDAAGRPLAATAREFDEQKLVIVAFPRTVEGRTLLPHAIELLGKNREPLPKLADAEGADVARFTLGAPAPPRSIASRFDTPLRPEQLVRIAYRDDAGAAAPPMDFPIAVTSPRQLRNVAPKLPGGVVPTDVVKVVVSASIDVKGRVRFPHVESGADPYAAEALAVVEQWLFEPARVNGAPVVTVATVTVTFTPGK